MQPDKRLPETISSPLSGTDMRPLMDATRNFVSGTLRTEKTEKKTFRAQALEGFGMVREKFNAKEHGDTHEDTEMFEALRTFFLEQGRLPRGEGAFQLIDAHNAIVRDVTNPGFHQALMASLMQEESSMSKPNPERYKLAVQAREYAANGARRRGEAALKQGKIEKNSELLDEGNALIAEARTTFGDVLHAWNTLGDHDGQARVVYELAYIAEISGDYQSAASLQGQSATIAEKTGDHIGATIARIEQCMTQLSGALVPPAEIISTMEPLVSTMRNLWINTNDKRARDWIANALEILGNAREAAGDIPGAIAANTEAISAEFVKEGFGIKLTERVQTNLARLTKAVPA